jgi:hypothetical protein
VDPDAALSLAGDNSLPDLAGRIRVEHEAVSASLKESVKHAIAAGELLIEAKGQLSHGRWLPWLKDHCTISERTAQLYMRVAKSRTEIEDQMRNGVADLSLNEAAALLMLSSDMRKLLNFAKQADGLSGESLVEFCIANDVGVITTPNYDPFAGRSEAEKAEWQVFVLFLSYDGAAGRTGFDPDEAWQHVQYLLRRPFQNVDEWLGPEGDEWRRRCGGGRNPHRAIPEELGPPSETSGAISPSLTSKRSIRRCALASERTKLRECFSGPIADAGEPGARRADRGR